MAEQGYKLDWRGDAVGRRVRQAAARAVTDVATQAANAARPNVPRQSGKAQDSVGVLKAEETRTGARVQWGSVKGRVHYFIWLELRHNALRNAADQFYPKLGAALKRQLGALGRR